MPTVETAGGDEQHAANLQNQEIRDALARRRQRLYFFVVMIVGVGFYMTWFADIPSGNSKQVFLKFAG